MFEYSLTFMPNGVNAYLGIGNAYENLEKDKKALDAYKKSLEALEGKKDNVPANFYTNTKEWLVEKIAELK